nr:hypothetical protein [uncultured Dysosmobacter sp.]
MKQVDRLLIEAKKIAGYTGPQLTLAMIEQDGISWTAKAHLWDRIPGHPATVETTTHATQDAAVEHIRALAEKYPNSRDVTIIVDDVG